MAQDQLQSVIRGCQMDLEQTRYLDFPGPQRYCHLVAGVVGEVAARIFGQSQPAATEYAHKLGLAFQLTNIIRDVGEDAMRVRIYLPVSELQQFDVKAHEILQRKHSDRFVALMRFQAQRAHALYEEALALLPPQDRRAEAGADDGEHLPHAAARDRGGGLPGAEPAHQPHAAAQAVARVEGAGPGTHGVTRRVAIVGAGWAGSPPPWRRRNAATVTLFEAARAGGRARTVPVRCPTAAVRSWTTASTS